MVADGTLHFLPFEALVLPSGGEEQAPARFLVQDHTVWYLPSVAVLRELRRREGVRETELDLIAFAGGDPAPGPLGYLTPRQREILQLVAEGRSAKEIATDLNLSTRTVEFHKYRIMETLDLHTTAELVHFAIKHGIVEVAPVGEKFNPDLHQAMATQPSGEVEPDHVVTVYQKGYTLNERLLRPALVIVSSAPPPADGA